MRRAWRRGTRRTIEDEEDDDGNHKEDDEVDEENEDQDDEENEDQDDEDDKEDGEDDQDEDGKDYEDDEDFEEDTRRTMRRMRRNFKGVAARRRGKRLRRRCTTPSWLATMARAPAAAVLPVRRPEVAHDVRGLTHGRPCIIIDKERSRRLAREGRQLCASWGALPSGAQLVGQIKPAMRARAHSNSALLHST